MKKDNEKQPMVDAWAYEKVEYSKKKERQKKNIESDIKKFLASGKKITVCK